MSRANAHVIREAAAKTLIVANITRAHTTEAMAVAHYLAMVVGKAHARQMDGETRRAWLSEVRRNRSKTIDAPSWLWNSIVELVSSHEAGYLEHCRRYAQAAA